MGNGNVFQKKKRKKSTNQYGAGSWLLGALFLAVHCILCWGAFQTLMFPIFLYFFFHMTYMINIYLILDYCI